MSKKSNKKSVSDDLIDFMLDDEAQEQSEGTPLEREADVLDLDADSHRSDGSVPSSAQSDDDRTTVIPQDGKTLNISSQNEDSTSKKERPSEVSSSAETKVSYGVSSSRIPEKIVAPSPSGAIYTSAEATLKQSEHLRVAQARVNELEEEVERLRRQNEQLAAAGETFQKLKDEYYSKAESLQNEKMEVQKKHDDEMRLAQQRWAAKERENLSLKQKIEELEMRLETNIRKIRKREKDLEHRLEIAKIEEVALVRSKDELILELKRKIDRLQIESENYNKKSQEIYKQLKEKQEAIKRVVRALRIALSQLEGEEESAVPLKKVE